jgi:hypothetical protein
MNMDLLPALGDILAGRAHVVFHVAGAEHAARIDILELGKDFFRRALGHVDDNVQTATMAHAHDQFHGAAFSGYVEDLIDRGSNEVLPSSEKRLLPR